MSEMYLPEHLAEYRRRREERLKHPTKDDEWNRFKYGNRWRSMALKQVPEPPRIPHPEQVRMMEGLSDESAVKQEYIARMRLTEYGENGPCSPKRPRSNEEPAGEGTKQH